MAQTLVFRIKPNPELKATSSGYFLSLRETHRDALQAHLSFCRVGYAAGRKTQQRDFLWPCERCQKERGKYAREMPQLREMVVSCGKNKPISPYKQKPQKALLCLLRFFFTLFPCILRPRYCGYLHSQGIFAGVLLRSSVLRAYSGQCAVLLFCLHKRSYFS